MIIYHEIFYIYPVKFFEQKINNMFFFNMLRKCRIRSSTWHDSRFIDSTHANNRVENTRRKDHAI
jgi:hypothetical protein